MKVEVENPKAVGVSRVLFGRSGDVGILEIETKEKRPQCCEGSSSDKNCMISLLCNLSQQYDLSYKQGISEVRLVPESREESDWLDCADMASSCLRYGPSYIIVSRKKLDEICRNMRVKWET